MTPFQRRLPQLDQFLDYMFSDKTTEWEAFVATGNFHDKGFNTHMLALYTCSHDGIIRIVRDLLIACNWTELLTPPKTIDILGNPEQRYTIQTMTDEVDWYVHTKFMNLINFSHDAHQHTAGRVSWVHNHIAEQAIARFVRIFAIDDVLIDLDNEELQRES